MHAAQTLHEPKGEEIQFGVLREGMLADLVLVDENPVKNIKMLYGTGWDRLNDETGQVERVGGIRYTIKDGIVYDAKQMLQDIERMVQQQRAARGVSDSN
jgi:imidazolonepropionase-like amidohydrolase